MSTSDEIDIEGRHLDFPRGFFRCSTCHASGRTLNRYGTGTAWGDCPQCDGRGLINSKTRDGADMAILRAVARVNGYRVKRVLGFGLRWTVRVKADEREHKHEDVG